MMMERMAEAAPKFRARVTGAVYLLYFATAICAMAFGRGIVVAGDAAATAANIAAHGRMFQLSVATGLVSTAFYVALTALLYELLKPVCRSLSLMAAFFSLTGCAVMAMGSVFSFAPAALLGGGAASGFSAEQAQGMAMLLMNLGVQAANVFLTFFGAYCLLIGWLVWRSGFLPRVLGMLLMLAGVGWLTFLAPAFAERLTPWVLVLGFVAELALCL
jgi:hypothetical protein